MTWAHQWGILLHCYLDDWLVSEFFTPPIENRCFLQFCQDLGIVVDWEKSDLVMKHGTQYLEMLVDTIWERVYLSYSKTTKF